MARLVGWLSLAAFGAWSTAALIVSGSEAGAPYLAAALVLTSAYSALPGIRSELRRLSNHQQTPTRTVRPFGSHLHGSALFREE